MVDRGLSIIALTRRRDSYPAVRCARRFKVQGMRPSYNKFPYRANNTSQLSARYCIGYRRSSQVSLIVPGAKSVSGSLATRANPVLA